MKKAIILFVLSLFTYGAVHADVSWKMSDDGTLTIFGTNMDDYELNNGVQKFNAKELEIYQLIFELLQTWD